MSWYRTYRPKHFRDLHIAPVRETFLRMMESGSFSHAYLFSGPKGTGKTSAARILAKVLNCEKNREAINVFLDAKKTKKIPFVENCGACGTCIGIEGGSSLCVSEIDAASNRGIDDIRALRERIGLVPGDGVMSVLIIDEVHMLTTEAWNALLKILEEPPAHVVFLLATTDAQKIPNTILSRCTRIQYRKANQEELVSRLSQIAVAQGITISTQDLARIARASDGSFRDGVKLFEQIANGAVAVTPAAVDAVLGEGSGRLAADLLRALLTKDAVRVVALIEEVHTHQLDGVVLQKEVLSLLHEQFFAYARDKDPRSAMLLPLLKALGVGIEPLAPIPWLPFEIALLEQVTDPQTNRSTEQQTNRSTEQQIHRTTDKQIHRTTDKQIHRTTEKQIHRQTDPQISGKEGFSLSHEDLLSQWSALCARVRAKSTPVEGLLRSLQPQEIKDGVLTLSAAYAFHKEQLAADRNIRVLEDALAAQFGVRIRILVQLGDRAKKAAVLPESNISGTIDDDPVLATLKDALL